MIIAKLIPVMSNGTEELHGELRTLDLQKRIVMAPNRYKKSENAPDYLIKASGLGGEINIGNAWLKRKDRIGESPFEFLSITIDDPSMPYPLNVAGFKNEEGGWDITWRRRKAA